MDFWWLKLHIRCTHTWGFSLVDSLKLRYLIVHAQRKHSGRRGSKRLLSQSATPPACQGRHCLEMHWSVRTTSSSVHYWGWKHKSSSALRLKTRVQECRKPTIVVAPSFPGWHLCKHHFSQLLIGSRLCTGASGRHHPWCINEVGNKGTVVPQTHNHCSSIFSWVALCNYN